MNLPVIIGVAGICCLLGAGIGASKGHAGAGAVLGLLLGPLGVLLALTIKADPAFLAARAEAVDAERAKLRDAADAGPGPGPDGPPAS